MGPRAVLDAVVSRKIPRIKSEGLNLLFWPSFPTCRESSHPRVRVYVHFLLITELSNVNETWLTTTSPQCFTISHH
jgi:hypothetical protein